MGKQKLYTAIIGGAVLGGLLSLINKDVRTYTNKKLTETKSQANYYLKHPSEAIGKTRTAFNQLNEVFENQSENVLNAMDQVENTLNKVVKKDNGKQKLLK